MFLLCRRYCHRRSLRRNLLRGERNTMMRYCPLFSGSSGNCTYVGTAEGGVLIDAGVTAKRIKEALAQREIDPSTIRAILLTHEHDDHINGLKVLCKQFGWSVVASEGTLDGLAEKDKLPCNGKSGNADPIIYEEDESRRVVIGGKIDRVDTYKYGDEIFVRVVDYKTGHKMFSPSDLEEGINLQMFLYLKAVVDTDTPEFRKRIGALGEEKLVPAGVIYAKTSISDAKVKHSSDEEAMRAAIELSSRDGMVLEESPSLDSMNPRYTPLTYPETSKSAKYNNEPAISKYHPT